MERARWIQVDAVLEHETQALLPPEGASAKEVLAMRRLKGGLRDRSKRRGRIAFGTRD